jgi:hypothetical protein
MEYIEQRLEHQTEYAPVIEALMQLAQNFTDQATLTSIIQSLNDLRGSLVDALNNETSTENDNVASWQQR